MSNYLDTEGVPDRDVRSTLRGEFSLLDDWLCNLLLPYSDMNELTADADGNIAMKSKKQKEK